MNFLKTLPLKIFTLAMDVYDLIVLDILPPLLAIAAIGYLFYWVFWL